VDERPNWLVRIQAREKRVTLIAELIRNFFPRAPHLPAANVPTRINASPKGVIHPCRRLQIHASNLRIRIDAFVPPKPKEFERTVRKTADCASFATMLDRYLHLQREN